MPLFAFYGLFVAVSALFSVLLLKRFVAVGRVNFLILATVFYAWLTSLSVVSLVPVDVFTTLAGYGNTDAILLLWRISYWSTQILTWAIIPILQNYTLSGDFTIISRLIYSLKRLWKFWAIVLSLSVAGILLAAGVGRLHLSTLPQLLVTLSNTYGLIAIAALLGYGLVEVPRVLWRRSFPEKRLKWHLHRVGKAAIRLQEASKELEKVLAVIIITSQQVPRADAALRSKADTLIAYVDAISPVPLSSLTTSKVDIESLEEKDLDYAGDEKGLAQLRARVKLAIAEFVGSRGEYLSYLNKGMELEALCKSRQLGVYSLSTTDSTSSKLSSLIWHYKCLVRPYIHKLAALLSAAASATIVWCEATIASGRHPDLSPFSLLVHDTSMIDSPWLLQMSVALPLAYVCACTYFSLFKLGSLGPYHMVPSATWSWSLLLNGSLLARFAAPLCFNYLHMIRMSDRQKGGRKMVFVSLMGMEDVPLLGAGFNTWFPLVMVVYVVMLTTNIFEDCFNLFVPHRFRFDSEKADDEHTATGARLMHAEHEVVGAGGALGEGIRLFGMSSFPSMPGSSRLGGHHSNASGATHDARSYRHDAFSSGNGGGDSGNRGGIFGGERRAHHGAADATGHAVASNEVELGGLQGSSSSSSSALAARQPLFGGSPSDEYDDADRLFASVSGGRSGRGGRRAW